MSEPIRPALTPAEWAETMNSYDGDVSVPPYPPDEREEFYNTPRHLAAICLYMQPFGFTREDANELREIAACIDTPEVAMTQESWLLRSLADRIEALLPPR